MRMLPGVIAGLVASAASVAGDEPKKLPNPLPLTRLEVKQYLEDLKSRKPRIPVPELPDTEKEKLGTRGNTYEGRLRFHYMPPGDGRGGPGGFGRDPDPKMTLTYEFKTELFWIVSRANNCHY